MNTRLACVVLILSILGSASCQRTLYDWGTYEQSVFKMYSSRENFSAAKEIDRLQREVERTVKRQRLIPPGKMAHLGYLYTMAGDSEKARECFEAEQRLFPESEHFMGFLLKGLQ